MVLRKAKAKNTRVGLTTAEALKKLEALRRNTVERHNGYAQRIDLAKSIRDKQISNTYRIERNQILGHQSHAGALPQHLKLRLDVLNQMLQ